MTVPHSLLSFSFALDRFTAVCSGKGNDDNDGKENHDKGKRKKVECK
jgi:hypothetical protein